MGSTMYIDRSLWAEIVNFNRKDGGGEAFWGKRERVGKGEIYAEGFFSLKREKGRQEERVENWGGKCEKKADEVGGEKYSFMREGVEEYHVNYSLLGGGWNKI